MSMPHRIASRTHKHPAFLSRRGGKRFAAQVLRVDTVLWLGYVCRWQVVDTLQRQLLGVSPHRLFVSCFGVSSQLADTPTHGTWPTHCSSCCCCWASHLVGLYAGDVGE